LSDTKHRGVSNEPNSAEFIHTKLVTKLYLILVVDLGKVAYNDVLGHLERLAGVGKTFIVFSPYEGPVTYSHSPHAIMGP
jgi:hypothetical protein